MGSVAFCTERTTSPNVNIVRWPSARLLGGVRDRGHVNELQRVSEPSAALPYEIQLLERSNRSLDLRFTVTIPTHPTHDRGLGRKPPLPLEKGQHRILQGIEQEDEVRGSFQSEARKRAELLPELIEELIGKRRIDPGIAGHLCCRLGFPGIYQPRKDRVLDFFSLHVSHSARRRQVIQRDPTTKKALCQCTTLEKKGKLRYSTPIRK